MPAYGCFMDAPLEFEWDEDKAALNFIGHGVAFPFVAAVFLDPSRADADAWRKEDGEERRKVTGRKLFVVVYSLRDGVHRLISARRTNRREDRTYGDF